MKKNYKKIVIPVIAVGAVGAVAIGSKFLLKGNEKDIKVGEITSNAIDSMNSVICSALNEVSDYEKNLDDLWLTKEQFSEETGLTGEKLDEYYSYYIEGKDGGESPAEAYSVIVNIIVDNGDAVLPAEAAEVATEDNTQTDTNSGNSSSGNSSNNNSGNSSGGNSSSSNIENGTQNQNQSTGNESGYTDEEIAALRDELSGGIGSGNYTPLTDEQRQAEEEAWQNMNGY